MRGAKALWRNVSAHELELYFPTLDVLEAVWCSREVVLVEDYVSALCLWAKLGVPACALGGTSLYEGHISTLLRMDIRNITLLLDADAIKKAVELKRSMSLAFPATKVIPLMGPDPKDMTLQQLREIPL